MPECIALALPVPPTMNTYWRRVGNRTLISKKGRAYKVTVANRCLVDRVRPFPKDARLKLEVLVHFPDRRVRDLDNIIKPLQDALKSYAFDDDSQIDELAVRRGDVCPGNPRVQIILSPVEEMK